MTELKLFTDGSVNPQLKIGYGAYLLINEGSFSSETLESSVKVKRFEHTSSTKLELQALLWSLKEICISDSKILIYTDCQNILGLDERRKRFEKNNYLTKKSKLINNHELYKEFYQLRDGLNCEFIKVKGHKHYSQKDEIDRLFTLVDKASRKALREEKS